MTIILYSPPGISPVAVNCELARVPDVPRKVSLATRLLPASKMSMLKPTVRLSGGPISQPADNEADVEPAVNLNVLLIAAPVSARFRRLPSRRIGDAELSGAATSFVSTNVS